MSADAEAILKLAYEQGRQGIQGQETTLASYQTRAVAAIGISGLIASFLGREAIQDVTLSLADPNWTALFAISALITSIGCGLYILRPRSGWIFHDTPSKIANQFARGQHATTLAMTYDKLAEFSETNFEKNRKILRRLALALHLSMWAVLSQIIGWLFLLLMKAPQ